MGRKMLLIPFGKTKIYLKTNYYTGAELAQSSQQLDIALAWYARGLRANPNWGDPWYFTGLVYEETRQGEKALHAYEQALDAAELSQVGLADIYAKIGRYYESSGNLQLAAENYAKALALDDFSGVFAKILSLNGVSNSLIREGKYEPAIELLTEAVKLYPSYEWSYIRLGRAYLACCDSYAIAIQNVEEAIRLNPSNKWAFFTAGDVYAAVLPYHCISKTNVCKHLFIDPTIGKLHKSP